MTRSGTPPDRHQLQQLQQHAHLPHRGTRTHHSNSNDAMTNKKQQQPHKWLLQKPIRNQQHEEPWLFQRLTLPPSALFSPTNHGRPFHLDVESLRSLLPINGPNSSFSHERNLHARLEAIVQTPTSQRGRRRKRIPKYIERKYGARIDSAKKRKRTDKATKTSSELEKLHAAALGAAAVNPPASGQRQSVFLRDLDDGAELRNCKVHTPPPLDDVDEKQRQKEQIAAQLNLTIEEFEAFDAGFGLDGSSGGEDDMTVSTARYRDIFQQFDVDGSGSISPDELREVLRAAGEKEMDDAELGEVIVQADTDKDGTINFEEFINLMRARRRVVKLARNMRASVCMVASKSGPSSKSPSHGSSSVKSKGGGRAASNSNLPPLRLAAVQSKKHMKLFNRNFSRPTPTCLRPGVQVDLTQLRRELAISEYGIQELNSRVREGLQWVQQNCPVNSIKAQLFCHRWGIEKLQQLFLRIQFHALSSAFYKWNDFRMYQINKQKANLYLKCKGSQKMNEIMSKWKRKVCRRKLEIWITECTNEARSEVHSAATEIQRIIRGVLVRLRLFRQRQQQAAATIQSLVRGRQGRLRVKKMRQTLREHRAACILQRCYRGYNGKRLGKALFRAQRETLAARKIQRAFRNHQKKALLAVIQRTKLENDSIIKIQCAMRRSLARAEYNRRRNVKKRKNAAVAIQSQIRRFLAAKRVQTIKEEQKAAIKIQTQFKGFMGRKRVAQMKYDKQTQALQARQRAAAITIQRHFRGFRARIRYNKQMRQKAEDRVLNQFRRLTSAVRIQSIFRGFRARHKAQKLRYQKLQSQAHVVMDHAALKIQACWRGHHGRLAAHLRKRARKALEEEQQRAIVRIQCMARGKLGRNELERRQKQKDQAMLKQMLRVRAALQIQRVYRGKKARQEAAVLRKKHAEEARKALDRLMKATRERAAIKIQSCARRYIARVKYTRRKQALERKRKLEQRRLQEEKASIVIQCAIRRKRARKLLLQRRREFERRISMMASEKAHDEIEKLRMEQEEELKKLKLQLMFEKQSAEKEAQRLKDELEQRRQAEQARREEEDTELAQLKLQSLLQKTQVQNQLQEQQQQQQLQQQAQLQLEKEKEQQLVQMEQLLRSQENEILVKRKMEQILERDKLQQMTRMQSEKELKQMQQEAAELQKTQLQMQRDKACLVIGKFLMKLVVHKRLRKLQQTQQEQINALQDEHERLRVKAEQEKQMALLKMQALFDNEAREREQELKQMEAQLLEKALKDKELNHLRNMAARRIQSVIRGYCGRQRVKKMQQKIEKERVERAKALEESLAAIEAEVAAKATTPPATTADEWVEYWDENAQASYYYNTRTQEASWTRPVTASKAVDLMRTATSSLPAATVDFQQDNYAQYLAPSATTATATGAAQSYADEYGFYDQYGQYHYYDNTTGTNGGTANAMMNTMGAGMNGMNPAMYSAMGMYPFMPAMAYNNSPMMMPNMAQQFMLSSQLAAASMMNPMMMGQMMNPMAQAAVIQQQQQQQQQQQALVQPEAQAVAASDGETLAEPWAKYVDEYSGSAYYYNSVTGEKYWA